MRRISHFDKDNFISGTRW